MGKQTKLFWMVTFAAIAWIVLMRFFTPSNIVQFELAKSVVSAQQIINSWGEEGIIKARTSIYLDFVFVFLYAMAISLGCSVATTFSVNKILMIAGDFFSRIIWFAGSCDIIENVAMLFTLAAINELTVAMAFYFAIIKFAIVLVALLLMLLSAGVGLYKSIITN